MISRATADCHSPATERTSTTAPSVSAARNVMMAITASSARPDIDPRGTIEASRAGSTSAALARPAAPLRYIRPALPSRLSSVDLQTALMQHQSRRVIRSIRAMSCVAITTRCRTCSARPAAAAAAAPDWDRHCRSARRRAAAAAARSRRARSRRAASRRPTGSAAAPPCGRRGRPSCNSSTTSLR